jgi:hypothetical protein
VSEGAAAIDRVGGWARLEAAVKWFVTSHVPLAGLAAQLDN